MTWSRKHGAQWRILFLPTYAPRREKGSNVTNMEHTARMNEAYRLGYDDGRRDQGSTSWQDHAERKAYLVKVNGGTA